MQLVILAGGYGTRISEETSIKPKPMIEIGSMPILWHIMKLYSHYGINDFIVCCGYKGYVIKEFFANYFLHMSDVTFNMKTNQISVHKERAEPWNVTLIDTGSDSMTGGRVKRISEFILGDEFCLTYGDGLADVRIDKLLEFHKSHKKKATLTACIPPGRFGSLVIDGSAVTSFIEKPQGDGAAVNGGFFVLSKAIFDYIDGDDCIWEDTPLRNLAKEGELMAFQHQGFWQPMDTLRDKNKLEQLWESGLAPWKVWN